MSRALWRQRIIALVVGAAVVRLAVLALPTGAGGDAAPAAEPGADASAARALVGAPTECLPTDAAARDRLEALREERRALAFHERLLRGQVELLGGLPIPWTEAVDPALSESALRPRLEALDAENPDVEVLEVDCTEFACLTLVETSGPDTASAGVSGRDGEAFATTLGVPGGVTSAKVGPDDARRAFSVIVAHPGPTEPLVAKRVEPRTAEAMTRARELLGAPEGRP